MQQSFPFSYASSKEMDEELHFILPYSKPVESECQDELPYACSYAHEPTSLQNPSQTCFIT